MFPLPSPEKDALLLERVETKGIHRPKREAKKLSWMQNPAPMTKVEKGSGEFLQRKTCHTARAVWWESGDRIEILRKPHP